MSYLGVIVCTVRCGIHICVSLEGMIWLFINGTGRWVPPTCWASTLPPLRKDVPNLPRYFLTRVGNYIPTFFIDIRYNFFHFIDIIYRYKI